MLVFLHTPRYVSNVYQDMESGEHTIFVVMMFNELTMFFCITSLMSKLNKGIDHLSFHGGDASNQWVHPGHLTSCDHISIYFHHPFPFLPALHHLRAPDMAPAPATGTTGTTGTADAVGAGAAATHSGDFTVAKHRRRSKPLSRIQLTCR